MPQWYTNWFSSRSYAFFLTTIFLLGAVFLLLPWNWARFVRLPSRRAILLGQAKELYRWAAITVGLWFLFAVGGGVALYGAPPAAATLFRIGVSYLLSCFLMANLVLIFRASSHKALRYAPGLVVFLLVLVDVEILSPELRMGLGWKIYLVFSWILYEGVLGVVVLAGLWLVTLGYLLAISRKRDIL
ncbi:hypothetical protein [Evtepia sp.]